MMQRIPPAGVIERWQPELDRIAPPTERGLSHFRLVWEPGEPWQPVNRWVVWEMNLPERGPLGTHMDLLGPPPRRFGRWNGRYFEQERSFTINQRQWEIHRETGLWGRPVWIVQGENGGHKRRWNEVEQNLIRMQLNTQEILDPPAMGDLEYAEPDRRTIRKLAELGVVSRCGSLLHLLSHQTQLLDALDRRERDQARQVADQLWGWLDEQVEETLQLSRRVVNEIWSRADADAELPDYEAKEEQWKDDVAYGAAF